MKRTWIVVSGNMRLCRDGFLRHHANIGDSPSCVKFYRSRAYALKMVEKIGGPSQAIALYEGDMLDASGRIVRNRELDLSSFSNKERTEWLENTYRQILREWGAVDVGDGWNSISTGVGNFELQLDSFGIVPPVVFGRFANPRLASKFTDCNPYSGKFNRLFRFETMAEDFFQWVQLVENLRARVEFISV